MITALPHRTHLVPSLLAGFLVAAGAADGAFRTKVAVINADQTVPAAISTADGCARVEVDTATNTLHYRIVFSGLSSAETAAHFHGPADIGATAGVLHTLPPGNPKVGTWNYDESIEADILAGRIYINIHSTTAPTGEIRGQLVDMISIITPAQTTPPSVSVGAGYGLFNIDTDADEVTYHIAFDGVLETVAHIHGFAMPTDGAGVLHPLPAGSPKAGTWSYDAADEPNILNGQTYVNIHSALFPSGEIRGQVTRIVTPLDGDQVTPPSGSSGHGCALLALDAVEEEVGYVLEYANLSSPTQESHIRGFAPPGETAGIKHTIGKDNPAVGKWLYLPGEEEPIRDGLAYFIVDTILNPLGEIRGQIEIPSLPCPVDIDCSGDVGFTDLLRVLAAWGPCAGCPEDLDGNDDVGFTDLLTVLSAWGPCP